jgi:hypothetical protein
MTGVDQRLLQGWHADPFGLHEQRYFSAGRPTKLVRDGRAEAYEEPPAQVQPAEAVAVTATVPPDDDRAAGAGLRTSAAPGSPATPNRGVPARRRAGLVNTVVALVAVAAVVAFVAIEGGLSPKHGPKAQAGKSATGTDLAAFVTASAQGTLARRTADLSLTATTEINGSLVYLRGDGQVDLSANTMAFNLSANYSGSTLTESEIMTSRALYIQAAVNGQSMSAYLGGKHWIEFPLAASATQNNAPQDSAAWSLRLLEQQGATVIPIGSRTVGGLACSGYAVTPSQHAVLAAAQNQWAEQGLSSSAVAAARQALASSTPPTISVWLDPTRKLVCELDIALQLGTGTSAGSGRALATESIQMVLTFTRYGAPVDITIPAESDTVLFPAAGGGG